MAPPAEMPPPAPKIRTPAEPPREWTLLELLEAAFQVLGWTVAGFIPMSLVFTANFTTPQPEPWISIASAIAYASMLLGPVIGVCLVALRRRR